MIEVDCSPPETLSRYSVNDCRFRVWLLPEPPPGFAESVCGGCEGDGRPVAARALGTRIGWVPVAAGVLVPAAKRCPLGGLLLDLVTACRLPQLPSLLTSTL